MVARRAAAAYLGFHCWRTDFVSALGGCILTLAVALPIAADDAVDPIVDNRPLSTIVKSRQYLDDLTTYLTGYETWVGPCPAPRISQPLKTLVLQRTIPFPGVATPLEPQWITVVRISGCARPYERAVYATVQNGKHVFYAQLMGTTRTEPNLQDQTLKAVVESEKRIAISSGCPITQPVRVLTASYVSEASTEYGKSWRESWTIINCKGAKQVPITFTPDHTGAITTEFAGNGGE